MKYKAYNLSLNKDANAFDQWDSGLLQDLLAGKLWKPKNWLDFNVSHCTGLPKVDVALVVIPARHHKGREAQVNEQLKRIDRVVLFLLGDEEADFDVKQIDHPNISIYIQNPHIGIHDEYNKIGTGYPKHFKAPKDITKTTDVSFAGQITHQRREELSDVLLSIGDCTVNLVRTKGFTQGLDHAEYAKLMSETRIAPCPSGAVIPDSFRLFEALESMALVVADTKTPAGEVIPYWDWLFNGEPAFAQVSDWQRLYGLVPEMLADYPHNLHKQTAWWIKYKRDLVTKVIEDLNA